MTTIQILYEDDHQQRALALSTALVNQAAADPVSVAPKAVQGLRTLVFWGHGDKDALCRLSSREVVRLIGQWHALNPTLDAVEIITCNARHYDDAWLTKTDDKGKISKIKPKTHLHSYLAHALSGKRINNSMAKQVKRGLKYGRDSKVQKIQLKSMPESLNGSHNQYSILYWDQSSFSWCYVTGSSTADMFEMGNNIKLTKSSGSDPSKKWGPARKGSFPEKVEAAKLEFPNADFTDVKAGKLAELRNMLEVVH